MNRTSVLLAVYLTALAGGLAGPAPAAPPAAASAPNAARLAWWRAARFGMFIHWGPVSLKGTEIGWSRGAEVPIAEYDTLYQHFNPVKFDADQWVRIAREAGMKYMVLTTKHHDGFCLFGTRATDFNVTRSPFGRDVVKELSAACRRQGIAFGTYYSVCDWHHPDFPFGSPGGSTNKPHPDIDRYEKYLRTQVRELIENYGPLSTLWFDVCQGFTAERGKGVVDFVRGLQPDILVNNRCANPGDYDTPEQTVGTFHMDRPWETCMTICQQWAWKPGDQLKSLKECIDTLARCAGGDGNLLLNVGPMPDGRIEPRQAARLAEVGRWLARYGQSIYGTRGGPYKPSRKLACTRQGNTVYLHVLQWGEDELVLPPLPRKIVSSSLLTGGAVSVRQDAGCHGQLACPCSAGTSGQAASGTGGLVIRVAPPDRQAIDTIVKLELNGPALDIPPIRLPSQIVATASNVYQGMDDYAAEMAFDGNPGTRWATDAGTHRAWVAIDLGRPKTLVGVKIHEALAPRVERFQVEYQRDGKWVPIFTGARLGDLSRAFPPVTAQKLRLNILEATEGPTIWEIEWIEKH
jgi:alpha-L-fucosidase